jgi:hypothetical protein
MDGDNNNPKPGGNNNDQGKSSMGSDFANESNLTPDQGQSSSGGPQTSERIKSGAKNAAVGSSETAQKVKKTVDDAKKVADPSMSSNKMAKEELQNAEGPGGKVDAAARVAAGKAAGKAAVAATGGAAAPLQGAIEKGTMVITRPENRKKVLLVLALPLIFIAFFIGILIYAASNPMKFVQEVLTDPKAREFAVQAAGLAGKAFLGSEETLKKYGYVEYKDGMVLAQNNTPAPPPGSIEEKITKIDFANTAFKTTKMPDCPYRFTYKKMVSNNKTTSVINKVYDRQGNEVNDKGFLYGYCLVQSMPLYNLMVRTQNSREINKFSNTKLNYADSLDSTNFKGKSPDEANKYVYTKTYDRITAKKDEAPVVDGFRDLSSDQKSINDYADQIRKALEENRDPNSIPFPIKNPESEESIAKTLCAFTVGYLNEDNLKKAIFSRLNTGQRSGIKWNTLSSTRELEKVSNEETTASFKQLDNWTASTAYSQNLYGELKGEDINPENVGNKAYGAKYSQALSLLLYSRKQCEDSKESVGNSILQAISFGFLGRDTDQAQSNVIKSYNGLREIIVLGSNGKFNSINDFGLEQLIIGLIRVSGGSAVSGLESGAQNFNNQSQGFRAISNQYMMRLGGKFLTEEEAKKLNLVTENTRIELERKNGIAYRLFGEGNIRSLANVIKYETPRTPNELKTKGQQYIATLSNPVKLIADTQNTIGYITTGTRNSAYAASNTGDMYMGLNTVGITDDMLNGRDVLAVTNEIQEIKSKGSEQQKKVLGYFDKCYKSNIPTENFFARGYKATNGELTNQVLKTEDGYPKYPSGGESEQDEKTDFNSLGFSSREELMACEIYLLPNRKETINDLNDAIQKKAFGINISDLANKYHIYLYTNGIVDLMVQLSSNEKDDSIYANSTGDSSPAGVNTGGIVGDIGLNSDSIPCPTGTEDVGVVEGVYTGSAKKEPGPLKVRLCRVSSIPGTAQDAQGNSNTNGAVFNSRVAGAFQALGEKAKADGIPIVSSSSFRAKQPCAAGFGCAPQGSSFHQLGVAIDIGVIYNSVGGSPKSASGCGDRQTSNTREWQWMRENAESFGIKQLNIEAWHWEATGRSNTCGK